MTIPQQRNAMTFRRETIEEANARAVAEVAEKKALEARKKELEAAGFTGDGLASQLKKFADTMSKEVQTELDENKGRFANAELATKLPNTAVLCVNTRLPAMCPEARPQKNFNFCHVCNRRGKLG
ncbi:hypothetical protein [Variovorax sp. GB1P17]|uniref:hypothetical protein n=1 Tax=Variovorax sp. GB1P17 TaxID=3443740 RepID=UPI003F44A0E4